MKSLKFLLPFLLLLGINLNSKAQDCLAPYSEPVLRVEPMSGENGFNVFFNAEQNYTLTTVFIDMVLDNPDWSIDDVNVNPIFNDHFNLSFNGPNMSFSWTYEVPGNSMANLNANGTLLFQVFTSNSGPWCTHVDFTNITTLYEVGGVPDILVTTGGCEANLCETNVDCSAPWEDPVLQVVEVGTNIIAVVLHTDAPFQLHSLSFNLSFSNPNYGIASILNGYLPDNRVDIQDTGNGVSFNFWTLNNQTAETVDDGDVLFYLYLTAPASCTWVNLDDIIGTEDIGTNGQTNCVPITMAVCETELCQGEAVCEEPFTIPVLMAVPVEGENALHIVYRSENPHDLTTMTFDLELGNENYIITNVISPFLNNPTITPPSGEHYFFYQWIDYNNPVTYSDGMIIARVEYDPGDDTECSSIAIANQLSHEELNGNDCVDTNLGKCDVEELCLDNNDGNCDEPFEQPTLQIVPNGNNSFWVKVQLPDNVQSMQIVNLSFTVSVNSPLYQFVSVFATPFLPGADLQWDANSATLTWPANGGMSQTPVTIWDGMALMYVRYEARGEGCAHIDLTSVSGLYLDYDQNGNHVCLPIEFNVCEADICDEENNKEGEEAAPGEVEVTPDGDGGGKGRRLTESITGVQIAPNPFSTDTRISFELEEAGNVRISIRDNFGRLLQTNESQYQSGLNVYRIKNGSELPNGNLIITIETDSFSTSKRILKIQ